MTLFKGLIVTTCKITPVVIDKDGKIRVDDKGKNKTEVKLKNGEILPYVKGETELKLDYMITFDTSIPVDDNSGDEAVFLSHVDYCPGSHNKKFIGRYVPVEKVGKWTSLAFKLVEGAKDATPLFCVHGFNVQPDYIMEKMVKDWKIFVDEGFKYFPVPVIWPCSMNYLGNQVNASLGAGKHLAALVNGVSSEHIPRKSLLMHSMGNHVVFDGACGMKDDKGMVIEKKPGVHFENIFMVSADIPRDVFWKKPWDYDSTWVNTRRRKRMYGQKLKKADNLFSMLQTGNDGKPKGKIYVVYNPWDMALIGSTATNAEKRLGTYGADDEDKIRDEFKDYIKGYNIYPDLGHIVDKYKLHSYQFEVPAIKFYYGNSLASED